MATPHVNILIANHNYSEWLEKCIASAANQTYKNISITVVDDGSTDNSVEILKKICEKRSITTIDGLVKISGTYLGVPFIAICLPESTGPSYARNVGIDATIETTDYFAILDADDEFYENKIERCVAELIQTPLIGATYADYDTLNTETGYYAREYKEPFSRERLMQSCIVHSGSVVSKAAMLAAKDEFGYYDVNMRTCEDYDLWMRISEKFMITHIAEPLTLVRIQPKNSTRTVDNSIWQQNWQRISLKLQTRNQTQGR